MVCKKTCSFCGRDFTAKSGAEKACSPACHRLRKNMNLRRYRARHKEKLRRQRKSPKARMKNRVRLKRWRTGNPEKVRLQWRRAYRRNPVKYQAKARAAYKKHRAKILAKLRLERKLSPDKFREACRRYLLRNPQIKERRLLWQREAVKNLHESYVRRLLNNSHSLPGKQWPAEVVSLYATILKLKRQQRQLKQYAKTN